MTIAIGFTAHVGLYLATDSQASYVGSTHMRPDEPKLAMIELSNGGKAIIAKVGTIDTADYFLEKFRTAISTEEITDARSVANIAERCMRECRSSLLANFKNESLPEDSYLSHIEDYSCDIILGYMVGDRPVIYILNFKSGWAIKSTRPFEAMGCGAGIASYVLSGFDLKNMHPGDAVGIAAYAVEMCKNHDAGCGGRTQIGILYKVNGSEGFIFGNPSCEALQIAAQKTEVDMQTHLTALVDENMKKSGINFKN